MIAKPAYLRDKKFLNNCFVWSCLTNANKCVSNGTVRNELCLFQNTEADKLLKRRKRNKGLLKKWQKILDLVKTTDEYNSLWTYGLHQICKEINIRIITGYGPKSGKPITGYKYDALNVLIKGFKVDLKTFYDEHITQKLFDYELLK